MSFFIYTLLSILILGLGAAIAHRIHAVRIQKRLERGELTPEEVTPTLKEVDTECCGQHEVCEKDSLLAALSREIEYYNDEELDRFRYRESDEYTEEETDEFRDILYTMRNDEVAGWVRSLQLRQVNLPDEIKDEVFLIIGERRA